MNKLQEIIEYLKFDETIDMSNINDLKDISNFKEQINILNKNYDKYLQNFIKSKVLTYEQLLEQIPENKIEQMYVNGAKLLNKYCDSYDEWLNNQPENLHIIKELDFSKYVDIIIYNKTMYVNGKSNYKKDFEPFLILSDWYCKYIYFIIDPITNSIFPVLNSMYNVDFDHTFKGCLYEIKENYIKYCGSRFTIIFDINDNSIKYFQNEVGRYINKDYKINFIL